MANYLLLRNNKESGPYSLEDLTKLGLKAYDLVWVQGRSAAWRYPSEVEELKPFAPAVEEQPFDRFYKKQSEGKKQEVPEQVTQTIAPEHEKYIPKKSVFVTMPGQKSNPAKPVVVKEESYSATASVQQTISITENPVAAAQVKYSQPLDEIKEMYVRTLQDRKQKIARKSFLVQNLKKAAILLFLIGIGVVAGLIIQSNGNKKVEVIQDPRPLALQGALQNEPAGVPAITDNSNSLQDDLQPVEPSSGESATGIPTVKEETATSKQPAIKSKPVIDELKKETVLTPSKETGATALSPGVDIDPATGERSRKVRTGDSDNSSNAEREKRTVSSNHVTDQVSVSSNEYKKVAFGGIRNLELTVTNDSKYTLDNVIVELQYLKPNELPLKTENIEFRSVGPKSASTVRIPDTNRGIKVVYRILNIRSRQMDEVAAAGN
jgi:hypothetical protein